MLDALLETRTVEDRSFPKERLKERQRAGIHCMTLTRRNKDERRQTYHQHNYKALGLLAIVVLYKKIGQAGAAKISLQNMISNMET